MGNNTKGLPSGLDLSELVWQAGPMVKFILLLLLFMSVLSIAIVVFKHRQIKQANRRNKKFLRFFWEAETLEAVYANRDRHRNSAMARVFNDGYREFKAIPSSDMTAGFDSSEQTMQNVQRSLNSGVAREIGSIERMLPFLAITASSAPFIGLFGTVWGIMQAFVDIGVKGSAGLSVVAPGIAEALIATAMGLFAAIPAVIFYNSLVSRIRSLRRQFDAFCGEMLNLVARVSMRRARGEKQESLKYEISV